MLSHRPKPSPRPLAALLAALAVAGSLLVPEPAHALEDPTYFWDETDDGIAVGGSYVPIVGDFGGLGNHLDDIIWYAPGSAADHLWLSEGDASFDKLPLPTQVSGTYVPLVGDFAGDGLDDIFWYAPGPAQDHLWIANGLGFTTQPKTSSGTYQPIVLDDGAGKDDIVWAKAGGGPGYVWSFEGGGAYLSTAMTSPAGARPLTGRFDDGACADVFWYAPGPAPDSLWHLNCAGTAGSVVPQTVHGTYQPTVENYSPEGDDLDDILWHRFPGLSSVWKSDGDGTWTASSHDIPLAGTPLPAAKNWGFAHIWSPTQQDLIFWDTFAGDFVAPLLNTEVGTGYTPIVGDFVGFEADVFFYKPGSAPERLLYDPA